MCLNPHFTPCVDTTSSEYVIPCFNILASTITSFMFLVILGNVNTLESRMHYDTHIDPDYFTRILT